MRIWALRMREARRGDASEREGGDASRRSSRGPSRLGDDRCRVADARVRPFCQLRRGEATREDGGEDGRGGGIRAQ